MNVIDKVKVLLGITDDLQDDLLKIIKNLVEAHFQLYTEMDEVPSECEFIIVEVMIKRFNRLGDEGATTKSVEGASVTYDPSDFKAYDTILSRLNGAKSGVKFL